MDAGAMDAGNGKTKKNANAAPSPDAASVFDAPSGVKTGGKSSTSSSKAKHASAEKLPGTFTVRGTVKSYKNHKLIVVVGHGPQIKVDISETAVIDVDTADLHNVSQGDKVTVKGQGLQNRVMAELISVELSNPLTGVKKKGSHVEKPAKPVSKTDAS